DSPNLRASMPAATPAGPAPATSTSSTVSDKVSTFPTFRPGSLIAARIGPSVGCAGGPARPDAARPPVSLEHTDEHRSLREADPGPGRAGQARGRPHARARGQAHPRRLRRLWRRDVAAAGR